MLMSERQWRVLSLLERLDRGEVTMGEVAASLGRSRRQVQRMRKRFAGKGAQGLVHGNAGRHPKHRTSAEVREQVVMLRRGKYEGFNDQHFTEKLVEVEGFRLTRETVRRILRQAGIGSPRKRRAPKHRQRRERKAQAGQMILWDGSEHDWLEGRGPRLCLMGAIDDATGEVLPGAHFTEQESTVGYLRVLRDILREKGIPHTVYGDRHSSLKRNDKHWTLEEELAGRQEPTQVGRVLANLGVEMIYALSAPAKGRVERLWGVLQDRLISELRLAGASTRGQANKVLSEYLQAHNKRFAIAAQDTQPAWRKAPSDHTQLLDLCALHYLRKVYKNHTVRLHGRVIDIPKRPDSAYATYAGKDVVVKHLLSGDYRVFYGEECIAWASGSRPKPKAGSNRNNDKNEPPGGDIFT
ncbi:MAG: ISNCY family transposase, partial [Haliangium ochraceum]